MPLWREAIAAWQVECQCVGVAPGVEMRVCDTCGGAVRPAASCYDGSCPWCQQVCVSMCSACGCGIHFLGHCGRWRSGACQLYCPGDLDSHLLCPDCGWQWVSLLGSAATPGGHTRGSEELRAHLRQVAASCSPGAGLGRACRGNQLVTVAWVRRWIRRRLDRAAWVRVRVLVSEVCEQVVRYRRLTESPNAIRPLIRSVVLRVVAELHGHGHIWLEGRGETASVRVRLAGQLEAPHRATHTRRHRRPAR